MKTRQATHLAIVFAAAIFVRAVLFKYAGIWGDWGFYVYNAELMHEGQTPFVDFIARSPLFMNLYAFVAQYGNQAYVFRLFVLLWWMLTALPVYGIAKSIRGHKAGVATLIVYLLAPFAITYGFWGNTQSLAAFLVAVALYVLVMRQSTPRYAVFGFLIAMAFLSRRSAVVAFAGIGFYQAWEWTRDNTTIQAIAKRTTIALVVFVATLLVGYLWLAQWDVERALALFEIHTLNLFFSSGRGGFPLLGSPPNPDVGRARNVGIPILHDLCQKCGTWTARTFAKTLVAITPVVGILLYYFRDWVNRWFTTRDKQYVVGVLGALGVYGLVVAIQHGFYVRSLAVVSMVLFAVAVQQTDQNPVDVLYHKHMVLLICMLVAFTVGYLYRPRLLHTYYFMDFWPAISILAGVLYHHAIEHTSKLTKVVLAVAVVLALINTSAAAYPIVNVAVDDNSGGWFTVDSVQEYGDDMDARTSPGDEVFASNPSYVALSHADMVRDNSRLYYTLVSYKNTGPGADIYAYLVPRLKNGSIEYVVHTGLIDHLLAFNKSAKLAFESNYCRVNTTGLYNETNATLYEYTNGSC